MKENIIAAQLHFHCLDTCKGHSHHTPRNVVRPLHSHIGSHTLHCNTPQLISFLPSLSRMVPHLPRSIGRGGCYDPFKASHSHASPITTKEKWLQDLLSQPHIHWALSPHLPFEHLQRPHASATPSRTRRCSRGRGGKYIWGACLYSTELQNELGNARHYLSGVIALTTRFQFPPWSLI
ncbi:unnamed protein product [Trypanosoma congolense IL3000]|uniref:WGS project CAEQ00000000 data, annotated contig 2108 n=1 Tax=Trypanosoma congolense (strain IL3000) TaxID=1068625 RepID=F9WBG9_TRYCI|nr:unnamed protein product [Trypanosoma congolense IL3000]